MILTKTQRDILCQAARSFSGTVDAIYVSGRGGKGSVVSQPNTRRFSALRKLLDAGLVQLFGTEKSIDTVRGNQKHYYAVVYRITDAGRQAAQQAEGER